jgi:hypothetical protein
MTSAYVISKDLIIPMPFEDYLRTLTPYMAPKRYYEKPSRFELSIRHEGEVVHIEATHTADMSVSLMPNHVKDAVFLRGTISSTSDDQTLIHYTINAKNIHNFTVQWNVMSVSWILGFLICFFITYLNQQWRFITIVGIVIFLYLGFALYSNTPQKPVVSKYARQLSADFENKFIQLIVPPEFRS